MIISKRNAKKLVGLSALFLMFLMSALAVDNTHDANQDLSLWSFRPLSVEKPPQPANIKWARTAIDLFILSSQESRGLHPNPPANRRTLARRAFLDLIGMPPHPQQLEKFLNDHSPTAWDNLIDQLLSSPHYGERWARYWMDVARFAESSGFEHDDDRRTAYHYRDFLIQAFNQNLPFDQFVQWQLAGDELAPENPLAILATGFLSAGVLPTQITEAEFESTRYDELDDMVSTTGVAFLGISVGCARCHDHKYDPISTREYYRLVSSFTSAIRCEILSEVEPSVFAREHQIWKTKHADLTRRWDQDKKNQKLQNQVQEHLKLEPKDGKLKVMVCSEGIKPMKHHADGRGYPHFYPQTYFLKRGDVKQKEGTATPGFLQALIRNGTDPSQWQMKPPENRTTTSFRRASLARWITDSQDGAGHLVARVIVNRIWAHHFGRGIVSTPNNLGNQGAQPTFPKLLDWLADDLITHHWKLKRLHKLIMTSSVYLQDTTYDAQRAEVDIENRYLWRFQPRRLEAEAIRDSMLAASGLLDPKLFGRGTLDPNMRRRSIYFTIKRSKLIPMMQIFDWPEHLVSIGQRTSTTIAPQALSFMNGPQVREYAKGLASLASSETKTISAKTIQKAYLLAYGRPPSETELQNAITFLNQQSDHYLSNNHSNSDSIALVDYCQALLISNEFLFLP